MKFAGHTMGTPGVGVFEAIDLVASAGMDGIEFRVAADGVINDIDFTPEFGARILDHAKKAGLEICAIDPYYQDFLCRREENVTGMKRAIDMAACIECPLVRIRAGSDVPEGMAPAQARAALAETLREIGDYALAKQVIGGVETHAGTLCCASAETLDVIERADHPAIRVILDWAFIYQANQDTVETCFERLGPYIVHVHAKDYAGCTPDYRLGRNCTLGEGDLGWDKVIRKLVEIGYTGYISDEYEKYWKSDLPEAEIWFPKSLAAMQRLVAAARKEE